MTESTYVSDEDLERWLLNSCRVLQGLATIDCLSADLAFAYPHANDLQIARKAMNRVYQRLLLEQERRQKDDDTPLCV